MLSQEQIDTMLSLQAGMNAKVDPEWVTARYPYLRAVVIEASEAIEHHGWKWWKKQTKDLPQLQMELIDIWHFLLSEILLEQAGSESAAKAQLAALLADSSNKTKILFDDKSYDLADLDALEKLELLIGLSTSRRIELAVFEAIMSDCDMNWSDLYCQYVAKNVLNFFRQDHGYKEGSYQKMWHGREDNEYLVDILNDLDPLDSELKDKLYAELERHYPKDSD